MTRFWVLPLAILSGCSTQQSQADVKQPGFEVAGQTFYVDYPKGFCKPEGLTAVGFGQLSAQNGTKVMLMNMVKCNENSSATPAKNYYSIITPADPDKQKVTREALLKGFAPDLRDTNFGPVLDSGKKLADINPLVSSETRKLMARYPGELIPSSDELCVYGGRLYDLSTGNGAVHRGFATCSASISNRRIAIFYNGYGTEDLLDMVRNVRALARSIKIAAAKP